VHDSVKVNESLVKPSPNWGGGGGGGGSRIKAPAVALPSRRESRSEPIYRRSTTSSRQGVLTWPLHDIDSNNSVGICCKKGGSRGNTTLRNRVCDEGGEWGAQTKGLFAKNCIGTCTYASK